MNMEKVKQILKKEVDNDVFSLGCDWINIVCNAYIHFLKMKYKLNVTFEINEDELTERRYDTGYTNIYKNNNLTIYIGLGLFKIMANGIFKHEKDVIANFFSSHNLNNSLYNYIINCIFISCIFTIINHEISHCILQHKKYVDIEANIMQEKDADCFAGSLHENIYINLLNLPSPVPLQNKPQTIAFIIYFSIIYVMFKINSIYQSPPISYPTFKERVNYIGSTFILTLVLYKHKPQYIINNFYCVYNNFYPTPLEIFNQTKDAHIEDILERSERIHKFLNATLHVSSTPEA